MGHVTTIKQLDAIEVLYETRDMLVFKVNIQEGKFLVIDYKNRFGKDPDTEIYYEEHLDPVLSHKLEYKAVERAVNDFMWDFYKNSK